MSSSPGLSETPVSVFGKAFSGRKRYWITDSYSIKPFKDTSAELKKLLDPLSLFGVDQLRKDSRKKFPDDISSSDRTENQSDIMHHDSHGLTECVESHLQQLQCSQYLTHEQQKEMIYILLQEVMKIEPFVTEQTENPILGYTQRKKISYQYHQCVIDMCRTLFEHYNNKANVLNEKGIFSETANFCRLRIQLMMHATKVLTVPNVRDSFLEIKESKTEEFQEKTEANHQQRFVLNRRGVSLMADSYFRMWALRKFLLKMPTINLDGLLPARLFPLSRNKRSRTPVSEVSSEETESRSTEKHYPRHQDFELRNCYSVPNLPSYETIWDDLNSEIPELKRSLSLENKHFSEYLVVFDWENRNGTQNMCGDQQSLINNDLNSLIRKQKDDIDLEYLHLDDMPPLMKALPVNEKRRKAREKLDRQIKELYEKEKEYKEEQSHDIFAPAFDQPTIHTKQFTVETPARTTEARISKRVRGMNHHLVTIPPQFNDLDEEAENSEKIEVKKLDQTLFHEKELIDVFDRILNTMRHDDQYVEADFLYTNTPTGLDVSASMRNKKKNTLNEELCQIEEEPWRSTDYRFWRLQPQRIVTINKEVVRPRVINLSEPEKKEKRDLRYWRFWWKSVIQPDDYYKFLCLQDTDYLSVIFHLYDERTFDSKRESGDSSSASSLSSEIESRPGSRIGSRGGSRPGYGTGSQEPESTQDSSPGSSPGSRPNSRLGSIGERGGKITDIGEEILIAEQTLSPSWIKLSQDKDDPKSKTLDIKSQEELKPKKLMLFQGRLDKMWNALQMPEKEKIDLVMKYATLSTVAQMEDVISCWEEAAYFIIQRETIMASLMTFESVASDPNRFFIREHGNPRIRLEEAKTRSIYYKKIEQLDRRVLKNIRIIKKKFGEVVTFQGRPYAEKMKWDRIEMLHWLQEIRKMNAIHYESKRLQIPLPKMSIKQLLLTNPSFTKLT